MVFSRLPILLVAVAAVAQEPPTDPAAKKALATLRAEQRRIKPGQAKALAANLDCTQAVIETHNRRFPADQWADVADVVALAVGAPDAKRKAVGESCARRMLTESGR